MTNYLSLALAYLIELIIVYIYFRENYEQKYRFPVSLIVGTGLYGASFAIHILLKVNFLINIVSFLVATLLFAYICFRITLKSSLFHAAAVTFFMAATELVVEMISNLVFEKSAFVLMDDHVFYIMYVFITKLLMFVTLYVLAKIVSYKRNNALGDMKKTYLTTLYPITISGFMIVDLYFLYNYKLPKGVSTTILILTVAAILITCFIVVYNQRLQRRENELAELERQQIKNEIDMQYLDLLEKKNQQMQILTHDYKNHLAAIRELGDNEQVAEYIDKMMGEIKSSNSTSHSGNHTLDIIINKYVTECELKHISFSFDTKLSNLGFVDSFDLVTILGNVFDNALEAAEKSKGRSITLSTKKVNTYDTIIISNSCDTSPDKNLKTSKKKGNHGLGLKSVEKTIKKYGGDFEWEYNKTHKTFTITIMLLNKED